MIWLVLAGFLWGLLYYDLDGHHAPIAPIRQSWPMYHVSWLIFGALNIVLVYALARGFTEIGVLHL
jgi:hypothetical protein